MLVTDDDAIADRARVMSLHGISRDAWNRYTASGSWYYEIEDAGYKYNMTDLAAALGLVQLERAASCSRPVRSIAAALYEAIPGVRVPRPLELPEDAATGPMPGTCTSSVSSSTAALSIGRGDRGSRPRDRRERPLHPAPPASVLPATWGAAEDPGRHEEYERVISLADLAGHDGRRRRPGCRALSSILDRARLH